MKLRNKRTGEIVDLTEGFIRDTHNGETIQIKPVAISNKQGYLYSSLAELNSEWEDYKEPEMFYWIDYDGKICKAEIGTMDRTKIKEIGNYFETKEEAEKAAKKLKAWKRLKDKGFRFTLTPGVGSLDITPGKFQIEINADMPAKWFCCDAVQEDLDACFGGKE